MVALGQMEPFRLHAVHPQVKATLHRLERTATENATAVRRGVRSTTRDAVAHWPYVRGHALAPSAHSRRPEVAPEGRVWYVL
jgi:hypothetical protein